MLLRRITSLIVLKPWRMRTFSEHNFLSHTRVSKSWSKSMYMLIGSSIKEGGHHYLHDGDSWFSGDEVAEEMREVDPEEVEKWQG
jgi:hypothetical protein